MLYLFIYHTQIWGIHIYKYKERLSISENEFIQRIMKTLTKCVLIFALLIKDSSCSEARNISDVNSFIEFIGNYTENALKYEFPTNAREYEASDTTLKGTIYNKYKFVEVINR